MESRGEAHRVALGVINIAFFLAKIFAALLVCLFARSLATMMWQHQKHDSTLNKHKPDRGGQAVWRSRAMACPEAAWSHGVSIEVPHHAEWQNAGWYPDVKSESGDGCSPTGQGHQKKRGEWNIESSMLSHCIASELLCCRAAPAPSLPYLWSLHSRTSYSIINIYHVRFPLSSQLSPGWERCGGEGSRRGRWVIMVLCAHGKIKEKDPFFL